MLQQTPVKRVMSGYSRFLEAFPRVSFLARARPAEVFRQWNGLGYNRRAIAIQRCAREIAGRHKGRIPRTIEELVRLPGIGRATAGAILAFAYNIPAAFIETNVRRVFIHFFFRGRNRVSDLEILPLVEASMDARNPREWFYALMDYGAMLGSLGENPNTRSAHYRRQPAFEGSARQLRGKILRFLLKNGTGSERQIAALGHQGEVHALLESLRAEGFVTRAGRRYRLT
jgi:A/G-specific adenine glycosylase